ncbi:MAG: HAD-IB family phosphatase [bacterium]|nr:HAD-IB family phosphatase [bacterium]
MHRPLPPPYATVVFDCDSTLARIEGIEALAVGREAEIRALTDRAMNGEIPLEEVYGKRLELMQPTAAEVAAIGGMYVAELLPNAREVVAALHALDKRVCVVSGGLLQPVRHVAREIGIGADDVYAVEILHDEGGRYAGFDEQSPLARAGGKLEVLRRLGPSVVLIGDGATDLEAAPACARFIAFGGVERREAVFSGADATCEEADLAALLPLVCDDTEVRRLAQDPAHAPLVEALPS